MKKDRASLQGSEPSHPYPGYFSNCQAKELTCALDFVECLNHVRAACPYLLAFAWGTYCFHPNRKEIVKQTKKK
jgi:hypothetical protein